MYIVYSEIYIEANTNALRKKKKHCFKFTAKNGNMAQWLRVPIALAEKPNSISR